MDQENEKGVLYVGIDLFARQVWIGNVLLAHIRWIADDDVEAATSGFEDFDKGDVPDKRYGLRVLQRCTGLGDAGQVALKNLNSVLPFGGAQLHLMRLFFH